MIVATNGVAFGTHTPMSADAPLRDTGVRSLRTSFVAFVSMWRIQIV